MRRDKLLVFTFVFLNTRVFALRRQEVTFRTLGDTWLPFMTRLGLDRHVYQPKSDRPQK